MPVSRRANLLTCLLGGRKDKVKWLLFEARPGVNFLSELSVFVFIIFLINLIACLCAPMSMQIALLSGFF